SLDDEFEPNSMDALIEADMNNGETHALYGTNIRPLSGKAVKNSGMSLMSAGTTLTYDFNVSDEDAVIFEIPFESYVLPTSADISLTNPDGETISLVDSDTEGNGNFVVQTGRDDGYFMYISVTDKDKLKNGDWTVTINNDNIKVNSFSCYAADNIAELNSVTASLSTTDPSATDSYKLNVSWTTDCESDSSGYLDVYLTEDKDIMSKVKTSNTDTAIGEHIGRVRLDSIGSGSKEINIPDSMASGNYYVVATLSSDFGGMSTAITSQTFAFTNANLPKPINRAVVRYGGNGDIYVEIEDADNADYTHYLVSVVASDGTNLIMDQFAKGEKVFIGKEAELNAGSEYHVEVQTLREDGSKFYYGDDIVKSDAITMPTIEKPVLLSVETNIPENGITNEATLEATYKFNKPVLFLGDINGDTVSDGTFKDEWTISYPLIDGDYVVDFEAIGENKDYVSASDFSGTVDDALLAFTVDTVNPALSLKQNVFDSIKEENGEAVETAFGSNVVIADDNGDFVIEGISELNAELTVDGLTDGLTRNSDGTFTYSSNLGNAQQREMEFKAVDKAGNTSTLMVYAISKQQASIESIEILNNGEVIPTNSNGEAVISLKKNQTANLTVRGITQDGETVDIENSEILWDVLYEKNLIEFENGEVVAAGTGETAVKAGMALGEVKLLDESTVDTAIEDYVIIDILEYTKEDLAAEIEIAENNIKVTGNATSSDISAYRSAIGAAKAVYDNVDASGADIEKAIEDLRAATEVFNAAKNNTPGSSSGNKSGGSKSKSEAVTYDVVVNAGEGGSASVSQEKVPAGNSVTITSVPNEGYEIDSITVNGVYYGNEEIITIASVNENINISVTFAKEWINPFIDVTESDWFYNNVKWANRNGLMYGMEENIFSPQGDVTRAMLVAILYRIEGEPHVSGASKFADVDSSAYYNNAVAWAENNGIVSGYSDTEFAPEDSVLREQIAAILYRYAAYKGYDVDTNADVTSYDDCADISEYALKAIEWTVGIGIISGKTDKTIAPADNATRAEVAAMIQRFEENVR
ncbi:MAG: S-layer homology domain-containing protein, partial [Hominilimicola sp.]